MGTHPIFESDFDCLTEMNATRYEFQVNIFDDQLEESALCLLHTILFHRTTGKFQYQKKGEFLIGTVGFQDVHCKTISLTYVKAASDELHSTLLDYVKQFKRQHRNGGSKTINLEVNELVLLDQRLTTLSVLPEKARQMAFFGRGTNPVGGVVVILCRDGQGRKRIAIRVIDIRHGLCRRKSEQSKNIST